MSFHQPPDTVVSTSSILKSRIERVLQVEPPTQSIDTKRQGLSAAEERVAKHAQRIRLDALPAAIEQIVTECRSCFDIVPLLGFRDQMSSPESTIRALFIKTQRIELVSHEFVPEEMVEHVKRQLVELTGRSDIQMYTFEGTMNAEDALKGDRAIMRISLHRMDISQDLKDIILEAFRKSMPAISKGYVDVEISF
jgi:hypothetical protein